MMFRKQKQKQQQHSVFFLFLQILIIAITIIQQQQQHHPRCFCYGFYISYEKPNYYRAGDSIPFIVNKLTSPTTLSVIDYPIAPICPTSSSTTTSNTNNNNNHIKKIHPTSSWQKAMQSMHGDMFYNITSSSSSTTSSTTSANINNNNNNNSNLSSSSMVFKNNGFFHNIRMLEEKYCEYACSILLPNEKIQYAITNDYRYNYYLDNLPIAFQMNYEIVNDDSEVEIIRHWGGIPVGDKGSVVDTDNVRYVNVTSSDLLLYNHYNFYIHYNTIQQQKSDETKTTTTATTTTTMMYEIVRVSIEPMSIEHLYYKRDNNSNTTQHPIESCRWYNNKNNSSSSSSSSQQHMSYTELSEIPPQLIIMEGTTTTRQQSIVHFTYDVHWIEGSKGNLPYKKRWNPYLEMDDTVSFATFCMGIFLGFVILIIVMTSLSVWLMRDLSYKPIMNLYETQDDDDIIYNDEQEEKEVLVVEREEDERKYEDADEYNIPAPNRIGAQLERRIQYNEEEVKMWPLSTRIFFPPSFAPLLLCIVAGTGAQNFITGFVFIVLYRLGILSQTSSSDGSNNLLSGAIIIYTICSPPVGGYVTGRLYRVLHGDQAIALAGSLVTAIVYPLLGMFVVWLVYDVLPHQYAPRYNTISNSTPVVYMWIVYMWPMTVFGGWYGYRAGPIEYFPVSKGVSGYQDLNLQDSRTKPMPADITENNMSETITNDSNSKRSRSQLDTSNVTGPTEADTSLVTLSTEPDEEEKKEEEYDDRKPFDDDNDDDDGHIPGRFNPYGDDDAELVSTDLYRSNDYAASIRGDDDADRSSNFYRSDDYAESNNGKSDDNDNNKNNNRTKQDIFRTKEETSDGMNTWLQWKTFRIPVLFLVAGILPVLSAFVHYSYCIAAPIFIGFYSTRTLIIVSFVLFVANAAAVTVLLYYRQIRVAGSHNQSYYYQWWWASIASGGSAGFYLFLLSMSWLLHFGASDEYNVSASTWVLNFLWFAYICLGAGLITGFCGLAACIVFNRSLYMHMIRTNDHA